MSENGRQRFLELLQNFTGILLLYPQGSVEILDDSDDVENRVKLWKEEVRGDWSDQLTSPDVQVPTYTFPFIPDLGSKYATLNSTCDPFIFLDYDDFSGRIKLNDDFEWDKTQYNVGFKLLTDKLFLVGYQPCNTEFPLFENWSNSPTVQGPPNCRSIHICNFLSTIQAKFLSWHDEKSYNLKNLVISDISLSTFTIHLRSIINIYGTVDVIQQTFSTLITKAFNDLQSFESNKQLVFDLLDINITSIKSWFAIIIEHGTIIKTNNVVLIGSKLNPVLYAFGSMDSTELKQKIRFFVEILGEVFRNVYEIPSRSLPVKCEIIGLSAPVKCYNLRLLLQIYGFFYDVDLISLTSISNSDLRKMFLYSEQP